MISKFSRFIKHSNPKPYQSHIFRYLGSKKFSNSTLSSIIGKELENIQQAGTYKHERIITSPQSSKIKVLENASNKNGQSSVLNFCANNYLGLADNSELIDVAKKTLDDYGFGMSSVRFICGTQSIHKELEKKIAEFHGTEDAILYPSCFDANAGFFEALLTKEDAVLSDSLNHASIIDGIRLCKAERYRYKHLDMKDLEEKLKAAKHCRMRIIATDGVFSMDGDVAPLDKICKLAENYDAYVFIDECHASGFFGPTGRGTAEYFGIDLSQKDCRLKIVNSTLGKALGGATGGYTAATKEVVDLLRQRSRPYLFSNAVAPSIAGASIRMFEMLSESNELCVKLGQNTKMFRTQMKEAGFTLTGAEDHPIVAVMLYDAKLASDFANKMLEEGIYVIGFSYPVVPTGQARIRVQLSAAHEPNQVQKAINAFCRIGRKFGVIKN